MCQFILSSMPLPRRATHLLSAHEEQMLDCMCHTRHILRVAEAADVDVHGCSGLVCLGIMDEQCFQVISELYNSVFSIVKQWLLERICQYLHLSTAGIQWFGHGCESSCSNRSSGCQG